MHASLLYHSVDEIRSPICLLLILNPQHTDPVPGKSVLVREQ